MHWVGVFMELSVIIPNFPFWVVTFSSELITLFIKPRTLLPTYIISHLSTLNFLCHFVTQSLSLTRPIYSAGHSALILHWLNLYPQQTFHLTANTFLQIIFEFVKRNQSLAEFHLGLFSIMPLLTWMKIWEGTWIWCWGPRYSALVYIQGATEMCAHISQTWCVGTSPMAFASHVIWGPVYKDPFLWSVTWGFTSSEEET